MHKKTNFDSDLVNKNKISSNTKLKGITVISLILFLIFLGLFIFTNSSLENLKQEYAIFVNNSTNTISSLNNTLYVLKENNFDLNKSLLDLTLKYNILSSKNTALEVSYSDLKEEVDSTIAKIDAYENEIQSSLDWFNLNSSLGDNHKRILFNLKVSCKREVSANCQINLGCFHLVNSEFINYKYKDDLVTSKAFDKLQSIDDFIKNKGGDCEDFSLFFKAEYNSLVESCKGESRTLFAWVRDEGSRFWSNFNETWYLSDATRKNFDKDNIYPVVVCGSILDPQSNKVNGHCILAFASKKIISSQDISVLNNSELIEPQTGEYLGFVGEDSGVFLISENPSSLSFIDTLITDNDFFIYRNNEWNNYAKFGSELIEDKNSLEALIQN